MAEPPAKRQKLDMSETVIIVAGTGDAAKEFTVHTSYAIAASKVIEAALSRDWKEAKERRITIPDTEPESMEGYLEWVYSNAITLSSRDDRCAVCENRSNALHLCIVSTSLELVRMYVLGDYLGDFRFCNAIIDTWVRAALKVLCFPDAETVKYVWERTAADSSWRELFLEKWKGIPSMASAAQHMKENAELPRDFLIDLLAFMGERHGANMKRDKKDVEKLWTSKKCKFHKHVNDSDKCTRVPDKG